MRALVGEAKLEIEVASAGTGGWHVGELPDPRTRAAAAKRGYELTSRARQFVVTDFDRFDLVVAMDRENLANLERMARGRRIKPEIRLLRSYDPTAPEGAEVPDPYSGGAAGFEHVLDICERACAPGLLEHVRQRLA